MNCRRFFLVVLLCSLFFLNVSSSAHAGFSWDSIKNFFKAQVASDATACTGFSLTIKDNKASFVKGDNVDYTYRCATGKAATVTIYVGKPDGTWTQYNSGTNIDTASMGFSTSNLNVGAYTLKACLDSMCSEGMKFTVPFAVTEPITSTTTVSPTASSSGTSATTSATTATTGGTTTSSTGSSSTTGGTFGSPGTCANGTRCQKGSWCQNGQRFFYSTGEMTCVAWSTDGTMSQPPTGTFDCDPNDSNCVNTGQTVDYVSGKWCGRGMQAYSTDGKKMMCMAPPNGAAGAGMADAPSGFTYCRPGDSNCKSKGDTWTTANSSMYCMSSQKCLLSNGGGSCVSMGESCPIGSKYCQSSDTNCIEPGEYKTLTAGSNSTPWCGGGSGMTFFSSTQAYCAPKKVGSATTPMAMMFTGQDIKDILTKLGSGWGICNPSMTGSSKCLEPGQTGNSSDWCAWWPPNSNGTMTAPMPVTGSQRTCANLDGIVPVEPPKEQPKPAPNVCTIAVSPVNCPAGKILVKGTEPPCFFSHCEDDPSKKPVICPAVASVSSCPAGQTLMTKDGSNGCPGYSYCIDNSQPKQCSAGDKCSANSWCQNGKQCYYPDGMMTCTSAWNESCPGGTKLCSPNDKNCIEPGATGPVDGWCRDAMECYTADGSKKFCQPMDYSAMSTTPAGTAVATMMKPMSCPTGTKSCRPSDKNCIEIGQKGPSTGWCAGGGKQCFVDSGLLCVPWSDSCPSNAKACRPEDKNCVEPGSSGPKESWCAGGAVQCYKKDSSGIYCAEFSNAMGNPSAWENAKCPADTNRCRADDKYCLELGASGPSNSWCAVGMRRENQDGTVTCISSKESMVAGGKKTPEIPKPAEPVCIQLATTAYDPTTSDCKNFATPCNVPKDWTVVSDGRLCQDGKLTNVSQLNPADQLGMMRVLDDSRQHLSDLLLQLSRVPSSIADVRSVLESVNSGLSTIKMIRGLLGSKSSDQQKLAQDKLATFLAQDLPAIDSKMNQVHAFLDVLLVKKQSEQILANARAELKNAVAASDYAIKLKDGIDKSEGLLKSATTQTKENLTQILPIIKDTLSSLSDLMNSHRKQKASAYLNSLVAQLKKDQVQFTSNIAEKKIDDYRVEVMKSRLDVDLEVIDAALQSGDDMSLQKAANDAVAARDRLQILLFSYGLESTTSTVDINQVYAQVQKDVLKRVDDVINKLNNRLQALVDTAVQNAVVAIANLGDKLSKDFDAKVTQSLSNLSSVTSDQREALLQSKTAILKQVGDLNSALASARLSSSTNTKLKDLMTRASTMNWCGQMAETVQAWMNRTGLALENKSLTANDVNAFDTELTVLEPKNNVECYRLKAASFKDVPMHEWYFSAAEFNKQNGYVKGYSDASGTVTGDFGPADPTLRIEALAMAMRMFAIPVSTTSVLPSGVEGVPEWGVAYVNGAREAGFSLDLTKPFDKPISRLECAKLFAEFGKKYLKSPASDTASKYRDFAEFKNDTEGVKAVSALTDAGVLQGSGGNFHPHDPLVRSEFATINKRLVENLGLQK